MERAYKRVLLAAVAVACLAAGPALADPGFAGRVDEAFERWDRAALDRLRQEASAPEQQSLARALGAFLDGDYGAAIEAGAGAARSDDGEIVERADAIVDLATSWQAVFVHLVSVAPGGSGPALRVPAGQEEWGERIKGRLGAMVDPYYEYFSVPPGLGPEVVFVDDLTPPPVQITHHQPHHLPVRPDRTVIKTILSIHTDHRAAAGDSLGS